MHRRAVDFGPGNMQPHGGSLRQVEGLRGVRVSLFFDLVGVLDRPVHPHLDHNCAHNTADRVL
jgi:hypothetical protein